MKQLDPIGDFEDLYAQFGKPLYGFCFRLMGNRQEAEDLMQDVFVAAFRGKERYRGDSSIRTWLWRIAVYSSRERHRKLRRFRWFRKEQQVALAAIDSRLALEEAIGRLPERLKAAFVLTKLEEMTIAEAALILSIPEGTVKYHVFEAMNHLRTALGDHEIAESVSIEEISTYAV